MFPLYVFSATNLIGGETIPTENISPAFRANLNARYGAHYTPEQILGYIYAVLHAQAYRTRYAEFLRIDFPRIPFPETAAQFENLAALGMELVETHLMQNNHRGKLAKYSGQGEHSVDNIRYSPVERAIWINSTKHFAPVPQEVWDFHIGGYQVIAKYLKSRKDRTLSLEEIDQVTRIAHVLAFTIRQMAVIDKAYAASFPAGG